MEIANVGNRSFAPKSGFKDPTYPIVLHREDDVWGYFSPEFGAADALRLAQEFLSEEVSKLSEATHPIPAPRKHPLYNQGGVTTIDRVAATARSWLRM